MLQIMLDKYFTKRTANDVVHLFDLYPLAFVRGHGRGSTDLACIVNLLQRRKLVVQSLVWDARHLKASHFEKVICVVGFDYCASLDGRERFLAERDQYVKVRSRSGGRVCF